MACFVVQYPGEAFWFHAEARPLNCRGDGYRRSRFDKDFGFTLRRVRSWPRGPGYFCLGKSNQNRVSRDASLRTWPLPHKAGKTRAAIFSPGYPVALLPCMRKVARPFLRFWPPSFFRLSPEAYLLTEGYPLYICTSAYLHIRIFAHLQLQTSHRDFCRLFAIRYIWVSQFKLTRMAPA